VGSRHPEFRQAEGPSVRLFPHFFVISAVSWLPSSPLVVGFGLIELKKRQASSGW